MRKLVSAVFLLLICNPSAQAQAPYYQGKIVTIVVGTIAGDLYDLYARAIALVMGKHIPGSPNIIVQNMPGAGQMIAAKYHSDVAKPSRLAVARQKTGIS